MKNVFIIGSKGIPAQYGGFETFVEKLTKLKLDENITYYVSCMSKEQGTFKYNNAECFNIKVPNLGPLGRIIHVINALKYTIKKIDNNNLDNVIVLILGCRAGLVMKRYYKILNRKNIKVFVNPDGLEWKRDKWNFLEKKILKFCEKRLVMYSDKIICDSKEIQRLMITLFNVPKEKTVYIAYGADKVDKLKSTEKLEKWFNKNETSKNQYYLIVGRFVPENNYETMISEFMKSSSQRDLIIITNVEQNKFYNKLKKVTKFENDKRIKFVGTVYDQKLLNQIRQNAFAYIHGHEVGGTNPSLLEALANTRLNILLDVKFNREVGQSSCIYFNKDKNSLSKKIDYCEKLTDQEIEKYGKLAKSHITNRYNWKKICSAYEDTFTK